MTALWRYKNLEISLKVKQFFSPRPVWRNSNYRKRQIWGGRNRFLHPATIAKWAEKEEGGERADSSDNVPCASSWQSPIDLTSRSAPDDDDRGNCCWCDGRSRECARRRLIYRVAFSACSRQQRHVLPPLSTNQGHIHAWARIFRRVCVSALDLIVL